MSEITENEVGSTTINKYWIKSIPAGVSKEDMDTGVEIVLYSDHCAVVESIVIDRDTFKSLLEDAASFLARQQANDCELLRIRDDKIENLEAEIAILKKRPSQLPQTVVPT